MLRIFIGTLVFAGGLWASAAPALDVPPDISRDVSRDVPLDFRPYEAVYDIRLIHASESKGPRAAAGSYEFRVDHTCDGWETRSHILLDLTFGDELQVTNERFFSSWEANAGTSYKFAVQTVKNGNTVEAFKGTATLDKTGGEAVYEALQGGRQVRMPLPDGTLLPMAHARVLLERARAGDALFRSVVMSGSSSTGPRVLSIAIGPHLADGADDPEQSVADIDPALLKPPGWQMTSAVFNLNERRDTPNFEMAMQLRETGVMQYFEQTFGDFTIAATLTRLKQLPAACR